MYKILVTGASGFIGQHAVARFRVDGHDVVSATRRDGDVAEEVTWERFPKCDVVVHLAGRSFVPESWQRPELFVQCNVLGATAALNYCRRHFAKLVYLSSYLYGNPQRLPISEDALLYATNPYALSKILGEQVARFYAENFGVPVTILRPFNVYGPGQSEKFLIPAIVKQLTTANEIRVKDLEPCRDYVHVLDVVDAISRAVSATRKFGVYNIGSGVSYSVARIVDAVQTVWGTSLPVISDQERRPGEIHDTVADVSAAELALGWRPRLSLLDGLRAIREWEAQH